MEQFGYLKIDERNKKPGYLKFILGSPYDEPLFSFDDFMKRDVKTQKMKFKCKKCGGEFEAVHDRRHKRCPNCYIEDYKDDMNVSISSLNRRIFRILNEHNIPYQKEFAIYFEDGIHRRYYDVKVGNVLIEANGNYWHANPEFFTDPDELLTLPGMKLHVKDIWEKDM